MKLLQLAQAAGKGEQEKQLDDESRIALDPLLWRDCLERLLVSARISMLPHRYLNSFP
jgi:hypothetical protein